MVLLHLLPFFLLFVLFPRIILLYIFSLRTTYATNMSSSLPSPPLSVLSIFSRISTKGSRYKLSNISPSMSTIAHDNWQSQDQMVEVESSTSPPAHSMSTNTPPPVVVAVSRNQSRTPLNYSSPNIIVYLIIPNITIIEVNRKN